MIISNTHNSGEKEEALSKLKRMRPIANKPFHSTVPELFDDLNLELFCNIQAVGI